MKRLSLLVAFLACLLPPSWALAQSAVLGPAAGYVAHERSVDSTTATMVNGATVFTVVGGPIQIIDLVSICVTANDATASTMQWQSAPTVGSATTFSAASASLASATAGTTVRLNQTSLAAIPAIATAAAGGVQAGLSALTTVVKDGTIKLVIGVGSTTGTWKHVLLYKPLSANSTVN